MTAPAQQFAAYFIELDCQVRECRRPQTYQVRGLAMIYQAGSMRDLVARPKCRVRSATSPGHPVERQSLVGQAAVAAIGSTWGGGLAPTVASTWLAMAGASPARTWCSPHLRRPDHRLRWKA